MAKVMKKISALLLTLALVFTMMPAVAITANAADGDTTKAFDVCIDGNVVGSISKEWLLENKTEPQMQRLSFQTKNQLNFGIEYANKISKLKVFIYGLRGVRFFHNKKT